MTTRRDASFPSSRDSGWIIVLAAVLAWMVWDAAGRTRHILQVTSSYGATVAAPKVDPRSPTGYADGRRSLILPDRSMDGYHWIMQAQAQVAQGEWRVRRAAYDGAPDGREVHWASPFRWWLLLQAKIDRIWTGAPWGIALERAAVLAGPILLAFLLLGLTPLLAQQFSPAAAAVFPLAMVAMLPCYVDFVAGYADHHGLVNACGLLGVLFLVVATHARKSPRPWVIAGAVAAGIGLWISAATEVPVLVGLGLGGAAACWFGRGPEPGNIWTRQPTLFRIWGVTGAAVSVAAYLLEYFPHHLGLRLEVNHPLYAIAWLGAGEALCRLARIACGASPVPKRRNGFIVALTVGIVALLPAVVLITHGSSFVLADGFLWRLHHDFIAEFQSLPDYLARRAYGWESLAALLPLAALAAGGVVLTRRGPWEPARSAMALALGPALVVLPLMVNQVRWWGLESVLLVPVIAVGLRGPRAMVAGGWEVAKRGAESGGRDPGPDVLRATAGLFGWSGAAVCALLYLPGTIAAVRQTLRAAELADDDIYALAERDLAHWLRQRAGPGRVVVAGSPTLTTALVFHGGLAGVGTLYWENIAGLKSAAELYAAPTNDAARAVVQRCGITHLVIASWDGFEGVYARLARGVAADRPIPPDTFIVRLLSAPVAPGWLRPVAFHLPPHPALAGQQVRVFEVTADQTPSESLLHTADYLLEMGRVSEAQSLAAGLDPLDGAAVTALRAELASRRNDAAEFDHALETLLLQLTTAPDLALEDRVRVVAVLATAGQFDRARAELDRGLRAARESDLRRLPTGTLLNLLALGEASGAEWPDPTLRQLAASLIPPNRRK